ncbi:MAG: TatD family hydrolase [Myxococcaceae bacterium]
MIDSHCHLDVSRFDADRPAVLERAWQAGLEGMVVPAIGPSAWPALVAWPARDARLQVALGIHPQLLPELDEAEDDVHLEQLDGLLAAGVPCAVGECGLDGPTVTRAPLARQLRVLDGHLRLAHKHHLPLLLHCQRAHPALQEWLQRVRLPEAGAVLHSYSGGAERVGAYLAKGCWFSFAGPVTWPEARRPVEALRAVPAEYLLAETDAPDQTPAPFRGQRSEPAFLRPVVEAMARHLGEPPSQLASRLADNARRFFARPFATPPAGR